MFLLEMGATTWLILPEMGANTWLTEYSIECSIIE